MQQEQIRHSFHFDLKHAVHQIITKDIRQDVLLGLVLGSDPSHSSRGERGFETFAGFGTDYRGSN